MTRHPLARYAAVGASFVLLLTRAAAVEAQATLVVDDDGQGSAVDCAAPVLAYASITSAIAAATTGDTVRVCPGTYVENLNFGGKAIVVRSAGGPDVTHIDGNAAGSVVTFATAEGATSVLDGFTIRNGRASFEGGGISVANSSPTIRNNVIVGNRACDGAGIAVGFGSPLIEGNTIADNARAGCSGGGGGAGIEIRGASSAVIRSNVIANNAVDASGGGILLFAAGTPTIERNVISGNRANEGGGIALFNLSDATIVGNLIVGNSAALGGGIRWLVPSGTRGPLVVNNTIADNVSPEGSGVLADAFDAATLVINNVVVAATGQTAISCGAFNDLNPPIFRSNSVFSASGLAFGGVCSDQAGLNGNISADPLFANAAAGDYRLGQGSPAIDAGDNTAPALPTIDLDGTTRPLDSDGSGVTTVDMGAYESPAAGGPTATITGTVREDGTTVGIGGIAVQAYTSTGILTKVTWTNGSGFFTLTGLPAGTYYMRTFAPPGLNYVDELFDDIPCVPCTVTAGTPIMATAGQITGNVDFLLAAGASLAGTVSDASSAAVLTGVQLQVYLSTGVLAKTAVSIAGTYIVTGLAPGAYYVRTLVPTLSSVFPFLQNYVDEIYDNIPCLNCDILIGTPVVLTSGMARTGIDFALSHGGVITGTVQDALSHLGLGGVTIEVYNASGNLAKQVATPAGGFYTVDGLPSGIYYARTSVPASLAYVDELFDNLPCVACPVTGGTPITVAAGAQTGRVSFALLPVAQAVIPGGTVSFSVSGADGAHYVSAAVVTGRSYCGRLSPGPTAVSASEPTLEASIALPFVTYFLGSSDSQVCFVAPVTDIAMFRVTQDGAGAQPYRLSVVETTMWASWFFVGGDYSSFTLLRNTSASPVRATVTWRNNSGAVGGVDTATIPPGGQYVRDARQVTGASSGSVEIAHDGTPQALVGSQTTLSATTGLSFDTLMFERQAR